MKCKAHKRNDCNVCSSYDIPAGRPKNINVKDRKKSAKSENYLTSFVFHGYNFYILYKTIFEKWI